MDMQEQPDVNRSPLPTIPGRHHMCMHTPLRVSQGVMPRASNKFFRTKSCKDFRPTTLLRQSQRAPVRLQRSRSCPPVLPDFHNFAFHFEHPIVRRRDRAWAFKYPEEARQVLIELAWRASTLAWASWEGWSIGWQEGSHWKWNRGGSAWSDYDAWKWINRDPDPTFIMTCIEGVTASMGEEAAWAAAARPLSWWQRHGGDSGARGSRD
jgi:hypothetical protein